jgi:hypothetical protein
MSFDFEDEVNYFRYKGLIKQNDIVIICCAKPSAAPALLGAALFGIWGVVGAMAAQKATDRYILAANSERLHIFKLENESGDFPGKHFYISKKDIKTATISKDWFELSYSVYIETNTKIFEANTLDNLHRYNQKEELVKFKALFKPEKP